MIYNLRNIYYSLLWPSKKKSILNIDSRVHQMYALENTLKFLLELQEIIMSGIYTHNVANLITRY